MLNGKRGFLLEFCMLLTVVFLLSNTGIPGSGLAVSFASADTVSGGNVFGIWTESNSPYYITDDITVASDDTLTIEPGVSVFFMDSKKFTINGILNAEGTESDSIAFDGDVSASSWLGIHFDSAQDYSHVEYCSIRGVDGMPGIEIECLNNSDPYVSHCLLTSDSTKWYPHIRVLDNSSPDISDCIITGGYQGIYLGGGGCRTITGCSITGFHDLHAIQNSYDAGNLTLINCVIGDVSDVHECGAGILVENGNLTLNDCTIFNCEGYLAGGGVYCANGTHTFSNCTFSNNISWNTSAPFLGGGGVCLDDASASVSYCTFYNNFASEGGGAISFNGSGNLTIDHCTIDSDSSESTANGIWLKGNPTAHISNSIISNNNCADNCIENQGTLTVDYTDFYENGGNDITGNVPSGFGELSDVNFNGDSCDVYCNIFMDPLYVSAAGDYHLTATSPCIDAGNPSSPYDPDSTITDMGAYFFCQTSIAEQPSSVQFTNGMLHISPCPCSGLLTISCEIPDNAEADICIYDLQGRLIKEIDSVSGNVQYDASGLAAGIYFCRLESGSRSETGKFVVER